jgi:hypothetical protein
MCINGGVFKRVDGVNVNFFNLWGASVMLWLKLGDMEEVQRY